MHILGWIVFTAIFSLAGAIVGGVDTEPRSSIEMKNYLAREGYFPLG